MRDALRNCMGSFRTKQDPVEIVAVTIDHLVEAVAVGGFIAMVALWVVISSGRLPV